MRPQEKLKYTLEEYFELEKTSEERFEFFDGEVFSMSGVSRNHSVIEGNLNFILRSGLRGRDCFVFPANMRVKVPAAPPYRYPDLSVVCGKAEFEKIGGIDTLTNPILLVEILSASTESYDRGAKFSQYKSIESFAEYILIDPNRPHVTQFVKQADNSWLNHEFNSLEDIFRVFSLDCVLSLAELYEAVEFPEKPNRYDFGIIAEE